MLKAGIVEPSDRHLGLFCGESALMRFCVGYWPLNKVTKKDSYPLPRIHESINLVVVPEEVLAGPAVPESKLKLPSVPTEDYGSSVFNFGLCNTLSTEKSQTGSQGYWHTGGENKLHQIGPSSLTRPSLKAS